MVRLSGALDIHTVSACRQQFFADIRRDPEVPFAVDASQLATIDGVGLGFIAEMRRESEQRFRRPLSLTGLSPAVNHLVTLSALELSLTDPPAHKRTNPISALGLSVAQHLQHIAHLIVFLGQLMAATASALRAPRQIRWKEFPALATTIGADAILIISLLGFLIGAILAFQTAVPLDRFGAVGLIPTIVGIAVVRELGPLIAAILVAGRTGAAFAAEIGTMRVTEELSALRIIGINPLVFLVLPRVLATVLMLPLLCVYTDVLGVLGGYTVMASEGYSFTQYIESFKSGIQTSDVIGGLVKTIAFAVLIASAGCQCGLQTGAGPGAVGRSTTRAVVSSIILIVVADLVFGFIYYAMRW